MLRIRIAFETQIRILLLSNFTMINTQENQQWEFSIYS